MITTLPLAADRLPDLAALFGGDRVTRTCWCMWFIIPVKDFHTERGTLNEARFRGLLDGAASPLGLLAYRGGEAVGWIAVGPRSRYVRAVRTPTLRVTSRAEDNSVWLAPCFFVRRDARGEGIARRLLADAVALARSCGATAIEGFPLSGGKRRQADLQVGTEAIFAACGFTAVAEPSPARMIMRLDFDQPAERNDHAGPG